MKIDVNLMRFKDWTELENKTGKKMGWWVNELGNGMENLSAEDLQTLVWVAGKRIHPEFTLEAAAELGPSDLVTDSDPTPSGSD